MLQINQLQVANESVGALTAEVVFYVRCSEKFSGSTNENEIKMLRGKNMWHECFTEES